MRIDQSTTDVFTAVEILGVAILVVALAIVVSQRLDRRSLAAEGSQADERLAGPEERADARAAMSTFRRVAATRACRADSLGVIHDDLSPAIDIVPWRPSSGWSTTESTAVGSSAESSPTGWTKVESDRLVGLLHTGFQVDDVAADLGVEPCAVVAELARRAFGAIDPVADPSARRFGQPWTDAEIRTLRSASSAGLAVHDIAHQLGRDQLSTVFRLLELADEARALREVDSVAREAA